MANQSTADYQQISDNSNSNVDEAKSRIVEFDSKVVIKSPYCNNEIKTAKYTILTWAPVSLGWQFTRAANIYFLCISILTCMSFSPKSPASMVFTFALVLVFTMLKEAYEDFFRHKQDTKENNRVVHRLDRLSQKFQDIPSKDLRVGDIVRIDENEFIPADIAMLSSSDIRGITFVNTMNLDGETNLKDKIALANTAHMRDEVVLSEYEGRIECDLPNENLNAWKCNIKDKDGNKPLGMKQLLLRGCVIKNTTFTYGIVVYTGKETKIVLNSKKAPSKVSNVLKQMNRVLYSIFLLQVFFCVTFACLGILWADKVGRKHTYLDLDTSSLGFSQLLQNVGTFMVAYSTLIPISLYVSLEMVKLGLSYFINNDIDMYYAVDDKRANCRTSDLIEELGQVEFVFTDKTGTLTCNVMEFKRCTIGGEIYGSGERSTNYGVGEDARPAHIMKDKTHPQHDNIKNFFNLMAVCHSVFPQEDPKNPQKPIYQASSPDELALVEGSADMGFIFWERTDGKVKIKYQGGFKVWDLLAEIPYNSTRKRMSVIARDPDTNKIVIMSKGADTIMIPLLGKNEDVGTLDEHLHKFALEGLRTLVMAQKYLDEDEFNEWKVIWDEISLSMSSDKDSRLEAHGATIENNLCLVGASAIEDKLQDGVPDAIKFLLSASIRVWMLTGDKQETAIEIGKSCNLIQPSMTLVNLSSNTEKNDSAEFSNLLDFYIKKFGLENKDVKEILVERSKITERISIVIDGATLAIALLKGERKNFFKLGLLSDSCICCRVSPAQKAEVVALAKEHGD